MGKKKENKDDPLAFLIIIIIIFGFAFFVYAAFDDSTSSLNKCKEEGWDGVVGHVFSYKCYKKVPHENGTGYDYEYSGYIN